MSVDWSRALAWRMRRQLLDPVGTESVAGVVRRLGAVPAQPECRGRARRPGPAATVPAGRGRSRPGRGPDHQDVRVPRRHPPADARGRRRLPRPAGGQPDVGAAQLAELLRPDAGGLAAASGGGPGGARRRAVDPGRARGGGHRPARVPASGLRLRRRRRHAAEAARVAGRHELRPAARRTGHLPAPGRQPALGGPARPRRGRACARSRRTSGRTGRRRPTTCATGSARVWARHASGSAPGSRASATAWRRSTSTGSPRSSCARIWRTWPERVRRQRCGCCPATTSGCSAPAPPTPTWCPPARRAPVSRGANIVDRRRRRGRDVVDRPTTGSIVTWFADAAPPEEMLSVEVSRLATILDRALVPVVRDVAVSGVPARRPLAADRAPGRGLRSGCPGELGRASAAATPGESDGRCRRWIDDDLTAPAGAGRGR